MSNIVKYMMLFLVFSLLAGCGGDTAPWPQFHADGPSQGFVGVHSVVALEPMWIVEVGHVKSSSPVIGKDGTIYVSTDEQSGELVAVDPDGTINWTTRLPGVPESHMLVTTPAVGEDGNIYVISTKYTDDGPRSRFHAVAPNGVHLDSFDYPHLGHTTSSPKTWGSAEEMYIFTYSRTKGWRNELLVLDQALKIVDRADVQTCKADVVGDDWWPQWLEDVWHLLTDFPYEFDSSGLPPPVPSVDPTVAVYEVSDPTLAGQPYVVVVDPCGILVFRWNPPDLALLWHDNFGDPVESSSPAVLGGGLVVLGRKDGRVLAYHLESVDNITPVGDKDLEQLLWEYDAKEPVIATPAGFGRPTYVVSKRHVHALENNGNLAQKIELPDSAFASPAVTWDLIYVSTLDGLHTFSFDLSQDEVDGNASTWMSSPAVGEDGTVYVLDSFQYLRAYSGP